MSEIQETNKNVIDFTITTSIPLVMQDVVVENVVNELFINGYKPVRYTYVFWKEVLRAYTDLDVDIDEDELYALIEDGAVILKIKESVSSLQLDNIENAVDEMIAYKLSRSGFDELCDTVIRLLNKYDEQLGAFLSSPKAKKILNNLSKTKFDEKNLVEAIIALQQKKDVK